MNPEKWSGRPPTTQEIVLLELRRRILTGALRPGEVIRPDAVAAELEVSRVPVREALKILEGENQVLYRPHHGYFVAELRLRDLLEIYRIRELLEEEAARNAITRLSHEDLERMDEALDEIESLDNIDIARISVANRRFHFTLLEAADMPQLQNHIRLTWNATEHYRALYYTEEANLQTVHHEHRDILDAAKAGDIDRLLLSMRSHREHAIARLSEVLKDSD